MIIQHRGKTYRVTDKHVEVYIPMGQPRVMQLTPVVGHYRSLKQNSVRSYQLRIIAQRLRDKEQQP
jgi:hypothetical protein